MACAEDVCPCAWDAEAGGQQTVPPPLWPAAAARASDPGLLCAAPEGARGFPGLCLGRAERTAPSHGRTATDGQAGEKPGNRDLIALMWGTQCRGRSPEEQPGVKVALLLWVWQVGLRFQPLITTIEHFW